MLSSGPFFMQGGYSSKTFKDQNIANVDANNVPTMANLACHSNRPPAWLGWNRAIDTDAAMLANYRWKRQRVERTNAAAAAAEAKPFRSALLPHSLVGALEFPKFLTLKKSAYPQNRLFMNFKPWGAKLAIGASIPRMCVQWTASFVHSFSHSCLLLRWITITSREGSAATEHRGTSRSALVVWWLTCFNT